MRSIFNMGKSRLVILLGIIVMLLMSFSLNPLASTTKVNSKEKAEQVALAIYNSSNYNEDTRTFDFDEDKAISLGLDKQTARQMSVYFKSLSPDEAETVYKAQEEIGSENQIAVAPIFVWAAGVLASAGLSWLAKKLLDYGTKKFCDAYRDYNSVTKTVCEVIAP